MSAQILGFFCMNGITTISILYAFKYMSDFFKNETEDQSQKMDYLMSKICRLERQVNVLNQVVEDMEDKFIKKENQMMKSTCELNSRLEEFIDYNYNVLE
jgi:hypothetical protein